MYPNQLHFKKIHATQMMSRQKGFLIPLAIFIVVIMGAFALVLSRNTIQTSGSSSLEMITVQTFYAAESGSYRGMQTLFFPNSSSRQAADTRCLAMNSTYNFSVTGLSSCSAVVTCTCLYTDNSSCSVAPADLTANYSASAATGKLTSFYKVSSVATCGNGNIRSVRTVLTGAMLKQE